MFDGNFREGVDRALAPVGVGLNKWLHLNANHLTFLGLVLSVGCMYYLATDNFLIGLIFFIFTGLSDLLDGPLAKAAGSTSVRGAFFDSLTDRIADALIFFGIAWHLLNNTEEPRNLIFLPLAILVLVQIVSYQRAKAESLGLSAKGGLMERAERFFVLGFGVLFERWLIPTLWVLLGLVAFTALQRFIKIMRQSNNSSITN